MQKNSWNVPVLAGESNFARIWERAATAASAAENVT